MSISSAAFEPLQINGVSIAPGERVTIDLPLPNLYTHTPMTMPVRVFRGRKPGPTLLVTAALHGDEINGVEIIRRLVTLPLLKRLRGTLIAVPVVNVLGFINHTRYLPDRRDLNRSFPGSNKGSLTSRLADLFVEELFSKATHGIDLHTGAIHRDNLPQVRANLAVPEIRALAEAFGTPVILDSGDKLIDGSLRKVAFEQSVPYIVYEAGEALRFDELCIRAGVRGVIAAMRMLAMLPAGKPNKGSALRRPVIAESSSWMRAPQSGIVRAAKPLGAQVEKDEVLAFVSDPFGEQESAVTARFAGIVVGCSNIPLVNEGDALFHVARVAKPDSLEAYVEHYHEELSVASELADPYNT
ncbi:MAG: succinylglutamate desuccinylase/aspartoacylase family protein [Gammaproteobacteria bacterium]